MMELRDLYIRSRFFLWPWLLFGLLLWELSAGAPARAEEVEIIGYEIPMLMDNPDKGLLVDLIREIGARAGMDMRFSLREKKQIPEAIMQNLAAIIRDERDLGFPGHASISIYIRKTFAFYLKGASRIISIYNLKGREVGMSFDYDADARFMELLARNKIRIRQDKTELTMMRYLHKNRVEALLMEEYAGLIAMKVTTVRDVTYEPRHPVWKKPDHILFPKTGAGRNHAARFNRALRLMQRDGSYKKFLQKAFDLVR